MKKGLFIAAAATLISGCASNHINDYAQNTPKLNLKNYLNGPISGKGIIQTRSGKVSKRFDFSGVAHWKGNQCTFDEKIRYYDGEVDKRVWHITKVDNTYYIGKADDVVGEAKITVSGNAMHWVYSMNVDNDGSTIKLNFDDWMYLLNNNTIINRNQFSKFGINVGSLTMYLHKK